MFLPAEAWHLIGLLHRKIHNVNFCEKGWEYLALPETISHTKRGIA
jgi:hypothetical protein